MNPKKELLWGLWVNPTLHSQTPAKPDDRPGPGSAGEVPEQPGTRLRVLWNLGFRV